MRRFWVLPILLSLLTLTGMGAPHPPAQVDTDPEVEAILSQMDPAARVGQLFLVTFQGATVEPESDIATLVRQYHVGGVVLLRENDNFSAGDGLPSRVLELTRQLQRQAAGASGVSVGGPEQPNNVETGLQPGLTSSNTPYIPLFIGIEQEGSGWPYVQILSGLTPLPSNMAIGATWDPAYAQETGQIIGQELSALGINLLLGPPADVVEIPQPFTAGDLGTRVFGGEPFWVSEMTAAYVQGVHEGSRGRMAVVPRHFPGYGGADRPASVEIPTVRRSRDQLTQFDLKPFFAVTGDAADPLAVADGLLVGHIRYQGFQGDNLRDTTRPISFDPVALQSLMSLPAISQWRASGGLLISDSLGLRGVRRFYDARELVFPTRRVALDAFGAGNDVLYLGNYTSSQSTSQMATVTDTIDFFVQRYEDDPAFAQQVDQAVRRILRAKLDLYGEFELDNVIPTEAGLADLGSRRDRTFEALTLLFPDQADLVTSPERGDTIAIFTDTRSVRQCSNCEPHPLIPVDALRASILRSYGPTATGLVGPADVYTFSFEELDTFLETGPQPPPAEETESDTNLLPFALDTADWIVFVMLDTNPSVPGSGVVKEFLAEPPVPPDTRIVVMAMGAPYYLDSTEVSKLTAFYALYGYSEPFIDVAAKALFQEVVPMGAPPVSVSAMDYDILRVTSPDPDQVISLSYSVEGVEGGEAADLTPAPLPVQGDTLRLVTGVIADWNGNPVPDGTPVEFVQNYGNEGLRSTQTFTLDGVAQASIVLDRPGELRVTVVSGEARNSEVLRLIVSETGSAQVDILRPDITPSVTPTPSSTPEPEPTELTAPTPTFASVPKPPAGKPAVSFGDLFLTLLGLAVITGIIFVLGFIRRDLNYGLLMALPVLIVGLLAYIYYALLLPGASAWRGWVGQQWGAGTMAWLGGLLGLGIVNGIVVAWNRWFVTLLRNRQRR